MFEKPPLGTELSYVLKAVWFISKKTSNCQIFRNWKFSANKILHLMDESCSFYSTAFIYNLSELENIFGWNYNSIFNKDVSLRYSPLWKRKYKPSEGAVLICLEKKKKDSPVSELNNLEEKYLWETKAITSQWNFWQPLWASSCAVVHSAVEWTLHENITKICWRQMPSLPSVMAGIHWSIHLLSHME